MCIFQPISRRISETAKGAINHRQSQNSFLDDTKIIDLKWSLLTLLYRTCSIVAKRYVVKDRLWYH